MLGERLLNLPRLNRRLINRGKRHDRATIDNRHLYILPTRHGLLFTVLLLAMLIGSINYSNSMGFMLTFLLGSLATASILHTYRNLKGVVVRAGRCHPVFAGERAAFTLHLDNPTPTPRYRIELGLAGERTVSDTIGPESHATLSLTLPTRERGYLRPGRIRVETTFPLGLFRAWSWIELERRCLVYPAPEADPPAPPLESGSDSGGQLEREGMDDFAGLRGHRPGDPLRHVAWKAVARGQPLMTKQFTAEEGARAWLDWSATAGLDTEVRLSRLCAWVVALERQRIDYALRLPGVSLEAGAGERQRHMALEALALHGKREGNDGPR